MSLFGYAKTNAQKVNSSAYNLMLKALLSHSVKEVTVAEADNMKDIVFVDSREHEEYNVSHIKNAVWVGYQDFNLSRLKDVAKNKKIVVYCSVGKRSEDITKQLMEAGYRDVYNLYGGIFEWVNENKPVYNSEGKTTKVHAYSKTWGIWLSNGDKVYK